MPESNDQKKRSRSPSDGDGVTSNKRANVGQGAASAGLSDNDRRGANNSSEKPSDDVTMADANGKSSTDNAPPVPAAQIHMRCLIVTQDASIIIGKGGSHVNEIREKSGAKVVVSESIPGNPERILNVSGPLDAVSKAFGLIVRRINDEPFDVPSVPGSRAVTIKFIIPNSRMGSVIGKGGSKIKEIQEVSGARLNASEGVLPGSTERVLSVSGVADAIHIATYYVGNILIEAGPVNHNTSSYRPASGMQQPSGGSGNGRTGGGGGGGGASRYPPNSSYNPAQSFGSAPMYGGAPSVPNQTQQIYIPNDLVGCIIGKGGSKINEIRSMSGSTIKIMEPGATANGQTQDGTNERLVTVTGQPQQIQTAVQLLYHRLEQEKQKQMANVSRSGV